MKSVKIKIFLSFLLLILMLAGAGVMSILEFNKIGNSVDEVLKNNYQSIEITKTMLDAIEEENVNMLIWMQHESAALPETFRKTDSIMQTAFPMARKNISEINEESQIKKVEREYDKLSVATNAFVSINQKPVLEEYQNRIAPLFLSTKQAINELMSINQERMYKQATLTKDNAQRAMMPGIISIVAGVIFALLLNFFISIYFINPIDRLVENLKHYYPERGTIDAKIKSDDEIKKLEDEINNLIRRLTT